MNAMNGKKAKLAKEEEQENGYLNYKTDMKHESDIKIDIKKPEKNWREIKDPTFDINQVLHIQEESKAQFKSYQCIDYQHLL